MNKDIIICRCSDISRASILELLEQGYWDLEAIKRITRLGMGRCQGKTCMQLIIKEIADYTGRPVIEIAPAKRRPPVRGIKLGAIVAALKGEEGHD